MPTAKKPAGARQKLHYNYLFDRMKQLEWDLHHPVAQAWAIPDEWSEIAARRHVSKKVRISLWIEEDVVKFFKSLGYPYQPRMNDVLKAFVHAKLAGLLREEGEIETYFAQAREEPRPELGDTDAQWETYAGKRSPDWE